MRRFSAIWLVVAWLVAGAPQAIPSRAAALPPSAKRRSIAVADAAAGSRFPLPLIAARESSGLCLLSSQGTPASGTPQPPPEGAVASSGGKTGEPVFVSDISVAPGSDGELTIDVATTKSTRFHAFRLGHPGRLVVDFEGARKQFHRNLIAVSSPVVKDLRVKQLQVKGVDVVRVVAEFSGDSAYDVHAFAGGVRIEVKPRPIAGSGAIVQAAASKLKTAIGHDEAKPIQPGRANASHVDPQTEPAGTRVSPNSNPAGSPAAKNLGADKAPAQNAESAPVLDDVLRLLFGQEAPARATSPPLAKETGSPPVTKSEPASVSNVSVRPGSGGEITIDVVVTKPSLFQASRMSQPDRLILDVKGARNQSSVSSISVASSVVKDVKVGQFKGGSPEVVRLVVHLSGNPVCDAHAYADGVRLVVKPRPLAASGSPSSSAAPSEVAAAPRSTRSPTTPKRAQAERAARNLAAKTTRGPSGGVQGPPAAQRTTDLPPKSAAPPATNIAVTSEPPSAKIYADGAPMDGKTPLSFHLSPGHHTLIIVAEGHRPVRREVDIPENGSTTVNVTLSEQQRAKTFP